MQPPIELIEFSNQLRLRFEESIADGMRDLFKQPACWQLTDGQIHRFFDSDPSIEAITAFVPYCLIAVFQNTTGAAGNLLCRKISKVDILIVQKGLQENAKKAVLATFSRGMSDEYANARSSFEHSGTPRSLRGGLCGEILSFIRCGAFLEELEELMRDCVSSSEEGKTCWFLTLHKVFREQFESWGNLPNISKVRRICAVSGNVIDVDKLSAIGRISDIVFSKENVIRCATVLAHRSAFADSFLKEEFS